WEVLVTSGKTAASLSGQRARLADHLADRSARRGEPALSDVAYTLQTGRRQHEYRAAVVARSGDDAVRALADGTGLVTGRARSDARVSFLFAGQGSQFVGMGRELFEREGVFREVFEQCARVVREELGEDLRALVYGEPSESAAERLSETRLQQPALFAVQYAMAEQWRAWGVVPSAMVGHSLGEYVAATVAGVWTLADAIRLVCARGDLMQRQALGAMLAVSLGEDEAQQLAKAAGCVVAAVNSPAQTVLSGPEEAVEQAARTMAERGILHRRLATSHAFHSPMMEPVLEEFERRVARVDMRVPRIPFASNVTGQWITAEQATSASYWAGHVRSAVRFSDDVTLLLRDEPDALLLEVGPGTAAGALVADHERARDRIVVASMRHVRDPRGDVRLAREAMAQLWVNGTSVNWAALHEHRTPRRVPLPTYAFDTKRYWIE
ncbi:acyltransferase domain-containing protein, partial [Streptomyces sp. NPDC002004]